MHNDHNSSNIPPNSMPPPNGNNTDFSRQQTLMQFLRLPDSYGKSHSFLEFPEDLQRTLRALAPWQLALLGFKASLSLLWNERALQQHQADAMLRLLPPHLRELAEDLCFSQPEELPKAQEVDFPMDAWCWLFRQDPFKPRQHNVPSGPVPSAQSVTVPTEQPEVADEQAQPDYPSKRPRRER
ncbi:hypothetical protein NCS57_00460200 [Fusarium keratoplasticum]|uniref:Uncharacterized protein n=1 Tax=Fusarium keratoplasticum TaxID=1328300 RepID=A0ACC0R933_9HYPO|nr:hypothetical protein NCS57_00460200 [Fusarium keratoplasticum]KAI8675585.1 hypothetical protein NCS57_00460200 [Fusarium keratoplasticum]